jgi:hypothetical protein
MIQTKVEILVQDGNEYSKENGDHLTEFIKQIESRKDFISLVKLHQTSASNGRLTTMIQFKVSYQTKSTKITLKILNVLWWTSMIVTITLLILHWTGTYKSF